MEWKRHPQALNAVKKMREGGVVACPMEAVWGLSCDPNNETAVQRLLTIKGRPESKGLILIADDLERLRPWLGKIQKAEWRRFKEAPNDHPITWLLPHNENVPPFIVGSNEKLAVRLVTHPPAAAVCALFAAPLVSTSANPSGMHAANSASMVKQYFPHSIACYCPGEVGNAKSVSEIRDINTGEILRPR